MIIFATYTHADEIHIAIVNGNTLIHTENIFFEERTLTKLLPLLFEKAFLNMRPDCIAFHNGPGGFTNLRVTASFLQGVAIGYGCHIYTPSHFEVLKTALQIDNGLIPINTKSAILPIATVENKQITHVEFLNQSDCQEKNLSPVNIKKDLNIATVMAFMAKNNKGSWILPQDLHMEYGNTTAYQKQTKGNNCEQ